MPNGFALQVGCPSGCQGSNLGVLPLFSLHFLASRIPLCFDTLKWLSLHALCVHLTLTSVFFQLPVPISLPLELFAKCEVLLWLSNRKKSWHSLPSYQFVSLTFLLAPYFSPRRWLWSLRYSARPTSAIKLFAYRVLTRLCSQAFWPTLFHTSLHSI